MKTWKITPANSLVAKYVDCYWLLEKEPADIGPEYPKLNPDPAAHLILCDPQQPYEYRQPSNIAVGRGSHLLLPYASTLVMDHREAFAVLGIKFQVGALYSLSLGEESKQLGRVLPLASLALPALDIGELLAAAADEKEESCWRELLDARLEPLFTACFEDRHSELVRSSLSTLADTSITEACLRLGCSRRTLERSFLRVTQLTLKQFQMMNKLELVLNFLYEQTNNEIDWSDIAARFGFSDQPHLIRHLKSSLGTTPGNYLKARDLAIDAYGNFE